MREDTTTRKALVDADCNVTRAAKALGISRQTLYRRMSQLGIIVRRTA